MAFINPNAHWRDSARPVRLFGIDYRATVPLMLFILHIRLWTFVLAVVCTMFLAILERFGFSLAVFIRYFRSKLAGKHKYVSPWWRE